MVGLHHDPASDRDGADRSRHGPPQHGQLVVDLHPQGLERPLGGVPAGATSGSRDLGVEQLDECCRGGEGLGLTAPDDRAGDLAGELLLAVVAQDPGEVTGAVGVQDVRGAGAGRLVHPHVEGRVDRVGEASLGDVELHRGDAEVEEHCVDRGQALFQEYLGDLVVDGVDRGEAITEGGEPLPGEGESVGVTVDADDPRRGAAAENRFGVSAETQGGVDQDRSLVIEGRCEESHDPVEEHRVVGDHQRPSWVSRSSATAQATDRKPEKAITATASWAWCRTRRCSGAPAGAPKEALLAKRSVAGVLLIGSTPDVRAAGRRVDCWEGWCGCAV